VHAARHGRGNNRFTFEGVVLGGHDRGGAGEARFASAMSLVSREGQPADSRESPGFIGSPDGVGGYATNALVFCELSLRHPTIHTRG
jgi:hypothetical protein